jgi:phospholipid/cholesterol/gamma-HCH transport system substrate-binding protein
MNHEFRDVLVGMLTLAILALVSVMSFARSDLNPTGTYEIKAGFGRIDGLNPGDEVRLGGIRIGTVAGARLTDTYRAILTFSIYDGVEIPADSSAAIHTDGLFGSKFIDIEPGAEEAMKPGGTITVTQDSVVVEDLLDLIIGEARAKDEKLKRLQNEKK